MTLRVHLMKAEPIGEELVDDLIIETIEPSYPIQHNENGTEHYWAMQKIHKEQAKTLVEALYKTLPQGTLRAIEQTIAEYAVLTMNWKGIYGSTEKKD